MFEPLPIADHLYEYLESPGVVQGVDAQCYPSVSDQSSHCGGILQHIKDRFLNAYFRSNRLQLALFGSEVKETERKRLNDDREKIQSAIVALENACLPFGFYAEAIETDASNPAWVKVLKFTHPTPEEFDNKEVDQHSSSSFDILITIPESSVGISGAVKNARVASIQSKRE